MLQGDYVEKLYVKLLTVISIKVVKCILPLLFDSPSYIYAVEGLKDVHVSELREKADSAFCCPSKQTPCIVALFLVAIQSFETFFSLLRLNFDMQQNLDTYK